jgi:hypothetical protein
MDEADAHIGRNNRIYSVPHAYCNQFLALRMVAADSNNAGGYNRCCTNHSPSISKERLWDDYIAYSSGCVRFSCYSKTYMIMELKDFIKETMLAIAKGESEASIELSQMGWTTNIISN